jgi:hypothetical protein
MKLINVVKKTGITFSHAHTIFSILKGLAGNNTTTTTEPAGLQAHAKGKDQRDKRITITAFARSIERLLKEYGPGSAEELIKDRADALKRAYAIMNNINSYAPPERRCISLTLGLRQEAETSSEGTSSKKKKKGKKGKPSKRFENRSGQDMIIMMALANNEQFTRETLRMMLIDNEIKADNIKKAVDISSAVASGITKGMKKRPEDEVFRSSWWLDLYPPPIRKKAINKEREAHKARMNALRTERKGE